MPVKTLVWFRNDLRLADNPALSAAAQIGDILPLYIFDALSRPRGAASKWALHNTLQNLMEKLPLCLIEGSAAPTLLQLCKEHSITHVFWNSSPHTQKEEQHIKNTLKAQGITPKAFATSLCPIAVVPEKTTKNTPYYKVFTPFWKATLKQLEKTPPRHPLPPPLNARYIRVKSTPLKAFNLTPTNPNWAKGFKTLWPMGEEAAQKKLQNFIEHKFTSYTNARDYPASGATSGLSPYLHFGCISPQHIYHSITKLYEQGLQQENIEKFLAELGWREFSYSLLKHNPNLHTAPFKEEFKNFSWNQNPQHLSAWQQGRTGYPLIDAGMRELWHTGWMHNRVRMVTASFLVKNLLLPWQEGEKWFWDTLIDADEANNSANWQWVAGCGADAAPYFRIFNPLTQSEKFDPKGLYIKKWVPELKNLPTQYIHAPFNAPEEALTKAGITLGHHYPLPIVDHKTTRQEALKRYKALKANI